MSRDERRITHGDVTGLRYRRVTEACERIAVFLPGAGHLARIAYGHDGADRRDFLDHWFEQAGVGLIAYSYPTDHAAVGVDLPDLTIRRYVEWLAVDLAEQTAKTPTVELTICVWSMAGRLVVALNQALRAHAVKVAAVISLAATAPLPGLLPVAARGDPITSKGYWGFAPPDGAGRDLMRVNSYRAAIAYQGTLTGHPVMTPADYEQHYLCNTPINLRGERQRSRDGKPYWSDEDAMQDSMSAAWSALPLIGLVIPTGPTDEGHALGDSANWSVFNAQSLRRRVESSTRSVRFDADSWHRLTTLAHQLPQRLRRFNVGGHFFFVGEAGARSTVEHWLALTAEIRSIDREIESFG